MQVADEVFHFVAAIGIGIDIGIAIEIEVVSFVLVLSEAVRVLVIDVCSAALHWARLLTWT
jgi:hypothetical protein